MSTRNILIIIIIGVIAIALAYLMNTSGDLKTQALTLAPSTPTTENSTILPNIDANTLAQSQITQDEVALAAATQAGIGIKACTCTCVRDGSNLCGVPYAAGQCQSFTFQAATFGSSCASANGRLCAGWIGPGVEIPFPGRTANCR